jgi:hypothetical protein
MTRTAIALSFDILMNKVLTKHQDVIVAEKNLSEVKTPLFETIREFNKKRLEIFESQFRIHKILWCTKCNQTFPESESELVLIIERKSRSCGYEGGDYTFDTRTELHRVCPACKPKVYARHGWYGSFDKQAKDQASYHAYKVDFVDGEYYQGGKIIHQKLPEIPANLFVRLSKEWGIPPELGLDRQGVPDFKEAGKQVFAP